jgi:PAS domain S-box-containing protein
MHRLLQRQIKKSVGVDFVFDDKTKELLELISAQYDEKDREVSLLENALEVSSAELTEANKKTLEQSERLTNTILDALSESLIAVDKELKVVFMNPAAKRSLGIEGKSVDGIELLKLVFGSNEGGEELKKAIESNNISVSGKELFVDQNGHAFPVSYTLNPIGFDIKSYGAVLSFMDIGQKIKDEYLLKLQEAALNAAANMIVITDASGKIEYVNDSFCSFTGFSRKDAVGQSTSFLSSKTHDAEFYKTLWGHVLCGEVWEGEIVNRKKDGSVYPEEMTVTPIVNNGKISHFVAIKRDISERKKSDDALKEAMDKAVESSRLKSEFLSTMSHEIRTPMNGIIGMTDLLLGTRLDEEQQEFVEIVKESSNALLTIINDILDFSKIEAGKMDIEKTDFELLSLVEGVAELFAIVAKEKKLSLMSYIDPSLHGALNGDPTRIRQVLTNLAGNALKFTEAGEVVISVFKAKKGVVRFEIADSGIGISEEAKNRLFQSFTQADGSTTRKYGGTGLGLAISKKLVELMGGIIGVDSKEGVGSTFWFELPLPSVCTIYESKAAVTPKLEGKKVLIVDDSQTAVDIVRRYVSSWEMVAFTAHNAKEALEILRAHPDMDAAVIDMAMPYMNGIELAQTIRERDMTQIKLLLFTAFDQRDIYQKAVEVGFNAYLTKPIKQLGLKKTILSMFEENSEIVIKKDKNDADSYKIEPILAADGPKKAEILLVEDNSVNQKLALKLLSRLGYGVCISSNGKEALEAVSKERFDIVLMDCQMPIMDGFEATRAIRAMGEAYQSGALPIIAMTANAVQGDRERCIAVGMDDYISKPIDVKSLEEKLEFWASKSAKQEETECVPVDLQRLSEIFGDTGMTTIIDILKLSENSTENNLSAIQRALLLDNFEIIYRSGHEIKGECGNIGILALESIGEKLEIAAQKKDRDEIAALLKEGRAELAAVSKYIDKLQKETK